MNGRASLLTAGIAFALGFALARANSCTVASTRRLVVERRPDWLLGLLVAVSWAGMTLLVIALLSPSRFNYPSELPIGGKLIAGSVILGIGALLNQGCFLGSISQLGRGNLRYVLTLVGIGAALLAFGRLRGASTGIQRSSGEALIAVRITWFACIAVSIFTIMILYSARKLARRPAGAMSALVAVGILGALIYVVDPDWSYTAVLDRAVHGQFLSIWTGELGAVFLFVGAILSSLLRSQFAFVWPSAQAASGSLVGGFLLGAGATLIPGGNDTLMLWSIPGLAGYGLVAYALMTATIALALVVLRSLGAVSPGRGGPNLALQSLPAMRAEAHAPSVEE